MRSCRENSKATHNPRDERFSQWIHFLPGASPSLLDLFPGQETRRWRTLPRGANWQVAEDEGPMSQRHRGDYPLTGAPGAHAQLAHTSGVFSLPRDFSLCSCLYQVFYLNLKFLHGNIKALCTKSCTPPIHSYKLPDKNLFKDWSSSYISFLSTKNSNLKKPG